MKTQKTDNYIQDKEKVLEWIIALKPQKGSQAPEGALPCTDSRLSSIYYHKNGELLPFTALCYNRPGRSPNKSNADSAAYPCLPADLPCSSLRASGESQLCLGFFLTSKSVGSGRAGSVWSDMCLSPTSSQLLLRQLFPVKIASNPHQCQARTPGLTGSSLVWLDSWTYGAGLFSCSL